MNFQLSVMAILMLASVGSRAVEHSDSNNFVFDHRGVELMRQNKELLGPWASYTLTRASCEKSQNWNPSFFCEALGREMLADAWARANEKNPSAADPYLDALLKVKDAGFLKEYVWAYLNRPS